MCVFFLSLAEVLLIKKKSFHMKAFFSIKMHSTESRGVMRPENILFAGASVHFSAPKDVPAGTAKMKI